MLSDRNGGLFADPHKDVIDAAVADVRNADLFVLVVGGRFGSEAPGTDASVTNIEFREAATSGIPIFTLVDAGVLHDKRVYDANRDNSAVNEGDIQYPAVDSVAIFDFIDEVSGNSVNNAYQAFANFSEIEQYLKVQWGNLFQAHLKNEARDSDVTRTLDELRELGRKTEAILRAVNPKVARTVEDRFRAIERASRAARVLGNWGFSWEQARNYKDATEFLGTMGLLGGADTIDGDISSDIDTLIGLDDIDLEAVRDTLWEGSPQSPGFASPTFVDSWPELRSLIMLVPPESKAIVVPPGGDDDYILITVTWAGRAEVILIRDNDGWSRRIRIEPSAPMIMQDIIRQLRDLPDHRGSQTAAMQRD